MDENNAVIEALMRRRLAQPTTEEYGYASGPAPVENPHTLARASRLLGSLGMTMRSYNQREQEARRYDAEAAGGEYYNQRAIDQHMQSERDRLRRAQGMGQ